MLKKQKSRSKEHFLPSLPSMPENDELRQNNEYSNNAGNKADFLDSPTMMTQGSNVEIQTFETMIRLSRGGVELPPLQPITYSGRNNTATSSSTQQPSTPKSLKLAKSKAGSSKRPDTRTLERQATRLSIQR